MKPTVYSADRAGNVWDVGEYSTSLAALWVLHAQQLLRPHEVHGLYDSDNPEGGDIQHILEEQLADDPTFREIESILAAMKAASPQIGTPDAT